MKNKKHKPPKIGEWLLKRMFPEYTRNTAPGDFAEVYTNMRRQNGAFKAGLWYWMQIVKSTQPIITTSINGSMSMLKNYFTVAIRNLRRFKFYSFINICGLSIGIACCILILSYVQYELSYDRYHENADRIYRIRGEYESEGQVRRSVLTSAPLAPAPLKEYPEVKKAVRFGRNGFRVNYMNRNFHEIVFFADSEIFDVFTFPLVEGDPKTVLKKPYSLLISESMDSDFRMTTS